MSKTIIVAAAPHILVTVMLMVAILAHPYIVANAKKMVGDNQISTSHTSSCDADECQTLACINNICHRSTTNSTNP